MTHILARVLVVSVMAVLVGIVLLPFNVPVPPLTDTVAPRSLASANSRFLAVNDVDVHYVESGIQSRDQSRGQSTSRSGKATGSAVRGHTSDTVILLLHGFGASLFTWREVIDEFGELSHTIAWDRPAFGLTERPVKWRNWNPYGERAQVDIGLALLEASGADRAILVANSAGARVAATLVVAAPGRVAGLVLVAPAIQGGSGPMRLLGGLMRTPQAVHLGPLMVRSISTSGMDLMERAWHDPAGLTPAVVAGYRQPLQAQNWDKALWAFMTAPRGSADLVEMLAAARLPVLVVTGDDDRVVPTARSIDLADELGASASLEVLESCGHVPQEECPAAFMSVVRPFVSRLLQFPGGG